MNFIIIMRNTLNFFIAVIQFIYYIDTRLYQGESDTCDEAVSKEKADNQYFDRDYISCQENGLPHSTAAMNGALTKLCSRNGLPDIRWHDLRSTYCTLLLKEEFNPKAVSKLMGHAKELITIDVYADNKGIIADGVPEIVVDVTEFLSETA